MALPTTISGTLLPDNPSFTGPFANASNVYLFARVGATNFKAHKATDPTTSFSAISDISRGNVIWTRKNGTDVLVIAADTNDQYRYSKFDMSSDSWATNENLIQTSTSPVHRACSIELRSSGEIVGAVQGSSDRIMGTDRARIDMVRSTDGTSWTVEDATNQTGDQIHFTNPVCVLGASDRVHIFYKDNTNNTLKVSTLLSNNTWGSRGVQVDTGLAADDFPIGRGISWVSGADTIIEVPYLKATGPFSWVARFTSADTPGSFTLTQVGSATKISSGFGLHGMSNDAAAARYDTNILSASDDLSTRENTGSGWGSGPGSRDLASVTHLSSNVIDR